MKLAMLCAAVWFMPHIRLTTLLMKTDPRGSLDECRIAYDIAKDSKVKEICDGLEMQVKKLDASKK